MSNHPTFRTNYVDTAVQNSYFPSVCSIVGNNEPVGTGFLIAPNIIITNHHVFEVIERIGPRNCEVFFIGKGINERKVGFSDNYCWAIRPPMADEVTDKTEMEQKFAHIPADLRLDYAVLELSEEVGGDITVVDIPFNTASRIKRIWFCLFGDESMCGEVEERDEVFILHKPGRAIKTEVVSTFVENFNEMGNRLFYRFEVSQGPRDGSSGALIFSRRTGRVVALHQAHNSTSGSQAEKRGIPIAKIAEDLIFQLTDEQIKRLSVRPEVSDEEQIQELVDLIESLGLAELTEEKINLSYLLSLPPGSSSSLGETFQLNKIIFHLYNLQGYLQYPIGSPLLDFFVFLEEMHGVQLLRNSRIKEWVKKTLTKSENMDDLESSSRARANEYLKKRTVNISVDIEQSKDSTTIYAPVVYLRLMGKHKVRISDSRELSGIKSKREFIQKLQNFWGKNINNLLVELEPQIVQIEFGVNRDTLDWDIGRSELNLTNRFGSYSFRIGEKYPYVYHSLEREGFDPHVKALKDNLNSQYQVFMLGIDDIPVQSKDEFQRVITGERKIICVYSFEPLNLNKTKKHKRQIIYDSILNIGIPAFIWCVSDEKAFDIVPFQSFASLDDFRNWLLAVQMDDRKNFDVLFDDPQHLLKFKDEGDLHV